MRRCSRHDCDACGHRFDVGTLDYFEGEKEGHPWDGWSLCPHCGNLAVDIDNAIAAAREAAVDEFIDRFKEKMKEAMT